MMVSKWKEPDTYWATFRKQWKVLIKLWGDPEIDIWENHGVGIIFPKTVTNDEIFLDLWLTDNVTTFEYISGGFICPVAGKEIPYRDHHHINDKF